MMSLPICEKCGRESRRVILQADMKQMWCPPCYNDWKFSGVELHHHAAFRDEIPGGIVLENYGRDPIRFDSHSERRAYMKQHDLYERDKFAPFPGTDRDPMGIPNPKGYVDPVTLANAAELICRNGQTKEFDGKESGVLGDTFNLTGTQRDAEAVAAGDPRRSSRLGRRIANASGASS